MESQAVRILEDGRVYFDYGPCSMVLFAKKDGEMLTRLCADSFQVVQVILAALGENLPELRKYPPQLEGKNLPGIAGKMLETVRAVGEPTLTPMATVAGAVADTVADWIKARGADTVVVNNGGDIAIRLEENRSIRMGILSDLATGNVDEIIEIRGTDGIGGVCTSGLGGRSLTRGIANSVTVFSDRCIRADACATHIANTSYVESERVHTIIAGEEHPGIDIEDLTVVKSVESLTEEEIRRGLAQMEAEMERQYRKGNLKKAVADIQGRKCRFGME